MKYNKIAMLVAGGLMVGAVGSSYAESSSNDISATIPEYGSIVDFELTTAALNITPTGAETPETYLSDYALNLSDDQWCVRSNAKETNIVDLFMSPVTVSNTSGNSSSVSSTTDMGGYSLDISVTPLTIASVGSYTDESKGVIDMRVVLGANATLAGDAHKHMTIGEGEACAGGEAMLKLTTEFTDTEKAKYAGVYNGNITLTLANHES
jgi:hypothetical protein